MDVLGCVCATVGHESFYCDFMVEWGRTFVQIRWFAADCHVVMICSGTDLFETILDSMERK